MQSYKTLQKYTANLKILYVEDDLIVATKTKKLLSHFFKTIDVEVNGLAGWKRYQKNDYDIVITDIRMPELNGIEMCRKILQINEEQHIIVTSAHNEADYLLELIEIGINGFISKPIDSSSLIKAFTKITKSIYFQKIEKKMQNKLQEQVKEFETILNFTKDAIVIVEDGKLIRGNITFLSLLNINSNEELVSMDNPLSSLLVQRPDIIYANTTSGLISRLGEVEQAKICLKVGKFEKLFLVNFINISDTKQCLILCDTAEDGNQVYIDVLTGLNRQEFIVDKISRLKDVNADFLVKIFSISNYGAIRKWLGPEVLLKSVRSVANTIKNKINDYEFTKDPVIGYYQENGFILIYHPDDTQSIAEVLDNCNQIPLPTDGERLDAHGIGMINIESSDLDLKDSKVENIAVNIGTAFMV